MAIHLWQFQQLIATLFSIYFVVLALYNTIKTHWFHTFIHFSNFILRERHTWVQVQQSLHQWCSDLCGLTVLFWEKNADKVYNTLDRRQIFLKETAFAWQLKSFCISFLVFYFVFLCNLLLWDEYIWEMRGRKSRIDICSGPTAVLVA